MAPSNTTSTGPPLGTFALTMCLTDGAEVRRMTMPSNNEQVTVWPPLVWSLSASEASSPALTMPLSPKANVFCSLVTAYGPRVTSAWWRFPFRIDSLPGGAVSSRMPYSCGALLHQGGHGCVQECGLLGDEVVAFGARTTLTNRRQSAWQWSPQSRRQSGRRILGAKPGSARTVSGNRTPVRLRPRPRGTAGQASVQHGRELTETSDKDAGRWARPT